MHNLNENFNTERVNALFIKAYSLHVALLSKYTCSINAFTTRLLKSSQPVSIQYKAAS